MMPSAFPDVAEENGRSLPTSVSVITPVVSGTRFPINPISASVTIPSAIDPLYRPRYGHSPRRFSQVDTPGFFGPPARSTAADVLIAASTSGFQAKALHPENVGRKDPSTGTALLP